MDPLPFLSELLVLVSCAALGAWLFERLRLPAVAGFLVTGAVVGPGGLGLVDDPDRVAALAELGVVFLLFEIGLELPLERLRRVWRRAALAGGLQVGATLAGVTLVARALGAPTATAIVIGALVAMSSTALVMGVLADRGEVDAPQGQLAVGILLFQDLCIVPFLLMLPILAAGEALAPARIARDLAQLALVLSVFYAVVRFVLPPLLDRVVALRSRDLFSLVAIVLIVGSAVLAEVVGLKLAVGAFVGGLVLSASPYSHQLFADVVPLRGVLLGVFFTAVGMLFDPAAAWAQAPAVGAYVAGVVVLKTAIIVAAVALVLRQGLRLGVIAGLTLAQTGEFSFVLATKAAAEGLLDLGTQQVFVAGSVLTLVATPFLIAAAPGVAHALGAARSREEVEAEARPHGVEGHAALVGFGLAGRTLARVLRARGIEYRAVDANPETVREARQHREPVIYGDATLRPILAELGVARARLVVIAISDPLATREVVQLARRMAPRATIVARTRYVLEVDRLNELGADRVVAEEVESSLALLGEALRAFDVGDAAVSRFVAELREEGYEPLRAPPALGLDPWLLEILEEVGSEWIEVPPGTPDGITLVTLAVRSRTGASILAVDRGGATLPNPSPDAVVRAGDRLLAFGTPESLARLRALLADGSGAAARGGGS